MPRLAELEVGFYPGGRGKISKGCGPWEGSNLTSSSEVLGLVSGDRGQRGSLLQFSRGDRIQAWRSRVVDNGEGSLGLRDRKQTSHVMWRADEGGCENARVQRILN